MSNFLRILWYGVQGFRRNIWLSVIAIITLTMTLVTLTTFAMGDMIAKKRYDDFSKQNIDYVIFVRDASPEEDVRIFIDQISARPEVHAVEYLTKDDVRKRFDEVFQNESDLRGIITDENNPLPREITVKFTDPQSINDFNTYARQEKFKEIVEKTSYQNNEKAIRNFVQNTNFLKNIGLAFSIVFTFIAILVVLNTIRLTIYSRREEVEIMRYVGATSGYIRGPFIIEGLLFGLLSAFLTAMVTWLILTQVQRMVDQNYADGMSSTVTGLFGDVLGLGGTSQLSEILSYLFLLQVGMGMLLGVVCSGIAVRRYLKESA